MKLNIKNLTVAAALTLSLSSCATILGGNKSTAEASGDGVGPATISDGSQVLNNDKFEALTIGGSFTGSRLTVMKNMNIESDAILTKVTVKDDSVVGGNLISNDSTYKDTLKVGGNLISNDSYFAKGIEFNGTQLELNQSSKVIGNIISTSRNQSTIVINHSTVKGDIGFAESNGLLVLKNKATFKGQLINGTMKQE